MKNENKNRECQFAVISSTGEKPSVQINMAGFQDPDGLAMTCHLEGRCRDLVSITVSLVEHVFENVKSTSGVNGEAAFIMELGDTIAKASSEEAMARVEEIEKEKEAFMKMSRSEKLEMLMEKLEELKEAAEEAGIELPEEDEEEEEPDDAI